MIELDKLNINIPVSKEILFILKKDEQSFQQEILRILALYLFKEKKLSLGKSAELAGMEKNEFVYLLGQHKIDIYQYSETELKEEIKLVEKLVEKASL